MTTNADTLAARLEDGYARIQAKHDAVMRKELTEHGNHERALATADESVSNWENFWITLLREYEAACR